MACASQSACPLFKKLPPELRNHIYGYVFTTDESKHRDLATAKSNRPRSDLLLTCQRVFGGTNRIYEDARIAYWTHSTFYLHRWKAERLIWPIAQDVVDSLNDRELALIRRITITTNWRNSYREWRLTIREDSMEGWIGTFSCCHASESYSLIGKRNGLIRVIKILS